MTHIEAGQLKKWLEDNSAVMIAHVEGGAFVVLVRSAGLGPVMGIGRSEDFEEALRDADGAHHAGTGGAGVTDYEALYFIAGGLVGVAVTTAIYVFDAAWVRDLLARLRRRRRPGIFTWRRLDNGEEEVILDDGRVFRGKGIAWYAYPAGVFAPDWLAKWLSEQSRAARMMHAVGTGRRRFVFDAALQKKREKRYYGDN
jgi:hypothetical protein